MADRAGRFGAVLSALWAAHDLADHVVQTDAQAAHKATSWSAMAGHVGSYTAVQLSALAALRTVGVRPSWRRMLAGVAVSAGTHALLDRRWPVRWVLEHSGSAEFADARFVVRDTYHAAVMRSTTADEAVEAAIHPAPLHGPYLADQALHHACLLVSALIMVGGRRG